MYVCVLLLFSAIGTTAIANNEVHSIFTDFAGVLRDVAVSDASKTTVAVVKAKASLTDQKSSSAATNAPMLMTIVQGADDEVGCSVNGETIARFILCGDSDDRSISLSGGPYSNVSWQILDAAEVNTNNECPVTNPSRYTEVSTSQTFLLDASGVPTTTGAEYRVVADGQIEYIEVIKSRIDYDVLKKNFVCNNPGRIEITGLPNSYQFRLRQGSDPFGPYGSSSIFSNLDPGTYQVQTRLNIGGSVCEYLLDPIVIEPVDIDIAVTFTNPTCSGETGTIDVEVSPAVPGPYVYTLLDDSGAEIEFTSTISSNTYTFGAVSEGIYAVQVETNDCREDIPAGIAAPIQYNDTSGNPIEVGTGLDAIMVDTDTNGMSFGCSTITDIDIDVTPSGGSGNYRYTVSDGGDSGPGFFSGTNSYTVFGPGTYTFFITDDQGCTAEKSEYVAELDPPDVTASDITGTCTNGGGKVAFNVSDAKGFNMEYRATNNPSEPFSSSSTLPVADGTYNIVEVRYTQGAFTCILALPAVTVTSAGGLTGSATLTQDYTCNNGEGIITFGTPSGGSGSGYEYSIDNVTYSPTQTVYDGLVPGTTYTPYIKDDANCYQALTPITIAEPVPPSAINFAQDDLDCAAGTSRVTIMVLPASFPVAQYEITSSNPATTLPAAQPSNVFPGLDLDTSYQFEITDTNGCTYPASFTTGGFSSIRARVKSGGDRRVCPGATDGNGAFLVDGFGMDYDYTVERTAPTATLIISGTSTDLEIPISALGAGTYEISVTDNDTNCISSASFDVVEATTPLSVTPNVTPMSCQNNNNGRVQANATGGFSGYRYELEWPATDGRTQGPKSGRTFGALTEPGAYTLTVIDSEGCRASATFNLTPVSAPNITFDSADYCYSASNDAEITVSSTIGSAALSTHRYRINGGPLQTPTVNGTYTFDNLVPGNYVVEVVDGNGCDAQTANIEIPPQIRVDLSVINEIPCGGDGQMQIAISGGDISNLSATAYTIEYESTTPAAAFTPVAGHNGVQLPSGSFQYNVPLANDGNYRVTVSDSNGCTVTSEEITFVEPTNIMATERAVDTSCGDDFSGLVEVMPTVSSGIPPFQVVFAPAGELTNNPSDPNLSGGTSHAFSSQTIYSGLMVGNYEYVVKDARNCVTAVIPVTIGNDIVPAPDATVTAINATCASGPGDLSGGVEVDLVSAANPDYTVIIEDNFGNQLAIRENVAAFPITINDPSLVPGNYQVIVFDARGCSDIEPLTIGSDDLDIIPDYPPPPAVCSPGGSTICVDIADGSGNYEIRLVTDPASAWQTPNTTPTRHCFSGLLPGVSYNVEVRDTTTNCTYEEVITPPAGPGPTVNLTIDNANCYNGDVGLEYTISSGTGPYDITITNLDSGTIVHNPSNTTITNAIIPVPAGPVRNCRNRYGYELY